MDVTRTPPTSSQLVGLLLTGESLALSAAARVPPWDVGPVRGAAILLLAAAIAVLLSPLWKVAATMGAAAIAAAGDVLADANRRRTLSLALDADSPDTHVAVVAVAPEHLRRTIALRSAIAPHLRTTTTHVALYVTSPTRALAAIYRITATDRTEGAVRAKLGQGGIFPQRVTLAELGVTLPPTPVHYLADRELAALALCLR